MTAHLSIVLPAFNEAHRLADSLERVLAFCRKELRSWEVIVIDDGSNDGTADIAREFPRVRCVRNPVNRGKGYSVKRGVREARGDLVLFSDVDLSTPIEEAKGLLGAIERGADVAIASRQYRHGKKVERRPLRRLMAAVFRGIVKGLVLRGIHDTQCGFKMFRRRAARDITSLQRLDGWAFDVELLFIARRLSCRIEEVPVEWRESEESRLGLLSPLSMLADLLRIRWNHLRGRYRLAASGPARMAAPGARGEGGEE